MKTKDNRPADALRAIGTTGQSAAELRRRAEERLSEKRKSQRSEAGDQRTAEDTARLIHELQVHRIELEMQNEELQQAQAQVETLLAQYTDLYDFAPTGYLTLDREGAIRQVNLTGALLFGIERSRLANRRFGLFVAEGDRLAFSDFLQRVFASQAKESCEVTLPQEGSQPLVVRIEGTRSADGQECRTVVMDITERKRAEQELQEKNSELERFLYATSHDLKSPLVTITTFLGYLEEDLARSDTGHAEKDLSYLRAATDKMGRSLNEILEMSRIGRIQNPPERVTFLELAEEAESVIAGPIAKRGVKVDISGEPILLVGDRLRLVQIWQNLVENAVKFMGDQAAPRIEIGVERRDSETVFFVRDNGMGIDPRFQARVFGLFQKVDPKSEGTGLGLALVERIVELYKGTIKLESEGLGQGACFRFTLPAAVRNSREGEPS